MMLPNTVTISRRTTLLFRFGGFCFKPTSCFANQTKVLLNPFQISGSRKFSSCNSQNFTSNYSRRAVFKHWGCADTGYRLLGTDSFRVSAASNGPSGGTAGNASSGGGYSGGKGEGGDSGGGGGGGSCGDGWSNWSLLSWYLNLLEKHPVLTKAVTSAVLTFIGDVICQVAIDEVPSLDLKRTFLFTVLGFVLVGPTLHFWYQYLSKLVTLPGASGAFLRLALDQFLFSPIFIGFFLSTLITLEGRPSQVVPKLQQEWFSAVKANWQLWIPFQFLNFRFVPQQFQVLAANFIALVWNVILSYKAHKEVLPK